jgi:hypothetical protein
MDRKLSSAEQARLEAIYNEYLADAKDIKTPGVFGSIFVSILLVIATYGFVTGLSLILSYVEMSQVNNLYMGIAYSVPSLLVIILVVRYYAKKIKRMDYLFKNKPGFKEFYRTWEKQQSKLTSAIGFGVALGVTGISAALSAAIQADRHDDVL